MKVSIIGPTGYTGRELVKILLKHPNVDEINLFGRRRVLFHEEFPEFTGFFEKEVKDIEPEKINDDSDMIFIALPHKVSMEITPGLRAADPQKKIIDLSADYRLSRSGVYQKAYGTQHKDSLYLGKYTYGLCEAFRKDIKKSRYVANPGCYPTGILIPLIPLLEKGLVQGTIIADSKSGASGAGKGLSQMLHFVECNENLVPYKIFSHQHAPEMMQFISHYEPSLDLIFTPQIIPVERGILTVLYVKLKKDINQEELVLLFQERFASEKFVRVFSPGQAPSLAWVKNTNFCDIGVFVHEEKEYVILISAIDNLVKGASGQAVQNMNIMLGIEETAGLL